jgi:hypothetical protein
MRILFLGDGNVGKIADVPEIFLIEYGDSKNLRKVDNTVHIYMVPSQKNRIHIGTEPS